MKRLLRKIALYYALLELLLVGLAVLLKLRARSTTDVTSDDVRLTAALGALRDSGRSKGRETVVSGLVPAAGGRGRDRSVGAAVAAALRIIVADRFGLDCHKFHSIAWDTKPVREERVCFRSDHCDRDRHPKKQSANTLRFYHGNPPARPTCVSVRPAAPERTSHPCRPPGSHCSRLAFTDAVGVTLLLHGLCHIQL